MDRPRNVLLILSDEHSGRFLGCGGHPVVRTPHLDALAARGTRFTRATTPSPICVPARGALATGRWVHDVATWHSAQPWTGVPRGWAHLAREAGARVATVGKLHFRSADDDHGADEVLPMHVVDGAGWVQGLFRRDPLPYPEAAELAAQVGVGHTTYTRYDERVADAAVGWLDDHGSGPEPWVLQVGFVAPHYPLSAPAEFTAPLDGADLRPEIAAHALDHPVVAATARFFAYHDGFDEARVLEARRAYLALCGFLDHNVGRVLAALQASGAADETLVVYASDHGDMAGNHGLWCKSYFYEDSVGIPMLAVGPGVPSGVVVDTEVGLCDVAPTVLDVVAGGVGAVDAPEADAMVGRSLLDLARGADPDRPGFSEYHDGGSPTGSFLVRHGDLAYVHHVGALPQLFDHAEDPDEMVDLGTDPGRAADRAACEEVLRSIVDPDDADRRAFADQAALEAAIGGREAVVGFTRFDHTPVPS